jgi:hypothetical protein
MHIDPPPIIDSSTEFDHENIHQFQISSSNDDDDEMALGDEAGVGDAGGNLSEEEGRISRSINVSPTVDEDSDTHEISTAKPLNDPIDHTIAFQVNDNNRTQQYPVTTHHQIDDDENDLYDNQNSTIYDSISQSNFGMTIQSWLRDLVTAQSNRRYYDRPWSKSSRPWSLDKIQQDIDRFYRFNEHRNAIEVSKKLLQNGVLGKNFVPSLEYSFFIFRLSLLC